MGVRVSFGVVAAGIGAGVVSTGFGVTGVGLREGIASFGRGASGGGVGAAGADALKKGVLVGGGSGSIIGPVGALGLGAGAAGFGVSAAAGADFFRGSGILLVAVGGVAGVSTIVAAELVIPIGWAGVFGVLVFSTAFFCFLFFRIVQALNPMRRTSTPAMAKTP
jgi:hypothetical protein